MKFGNKATLMARYIK